MVEGWGGRERGPREGTLGRRRQVEMSAAFFFPSHALAPPPSQKTPRPPVPRAQVVRLRSIIASLTKDGPAATDRSALRRATHALAELAKTGKQNERRERE